MQRAGWINLFVNHVDAWVLALVVASLALLLHKALTPRALPLILTVGAGYWLAFVLNDYFDAPADALEPDKARGNYFVGLDSTRAVGVMAAAFLLVGPAAMLVIGAYGARGWIVLAAGLAVMWAYSAPPLRLKSRPGADLLTHALFVETYPYVICVFLIGADWNELDGFILCLLFLGSLTAQLEQQLRDYAVDIRTGTNSTIRLGRKTAHRLLVIGTAVLIVVALGFWLIRGGPRFLVPFGLILAPALAHRLVRGLDRPRLPWLVRLSAIAGLTYIAFIITYFMLANN